MSECSVCKKSASKTRNAIACSGCRKLCHGTCVNLTREDIDFMTSQDQVWRCPPCSKLHRKSMSGEETEEHADFTLVIRMLEEAKTDRKRMEDEMNKAFEFVHQTVKDQQETLKRQDERLASYLEKMERMTEENLRLRKQVAELEVRLDECEQYSRSNTVEILGLPENKQEDVYTLVEKVCGNLDVIITRNDIDVCHRLGKRQGVDRPAGVIVRFVRREIKQKLLEKRRIKRNFSTANLGYDGPAEPVYINESLSPGKRKLLAAARAAKKEKNYTFLWVRNGKIFMRKNQGDSVIVIQSMDTVANLK